ncbi:MAG: hypothetical protein H7Y42_01640 [Chitinophagaceae bacterium]|nr:hypothetical protein [Chitinophagaceae bacterium]
MRSRQLNFFIIPGDLKEIFLFLEEQQAIIIRRNSPSKEDAFKPISADELTQMFQVHLTTRNFQNKVRFKYLEAKNYYHVDSLISPVIEFSTGGFYANSDKVLHKARLYFVSAYYHGSQLVQKDEEFIKWVDGTFKKFKKRFLIKVPKIGDEYVSTNCVKWIEENNAKLEPSGLEPVIS